jgi:hypothetical protein
MKPPGKLDSPYLRATKLIVFGVGGLRMRAHQLFFVDRINQARHRFLVTFDSDFAVDRQLLDVAPGVQPDRRLLRYCGQAREHLQDGND